MATTWLVCGGGFALLLLLGLLIDVGGTGLATREQAAGLADQAARAGAAQISAASLGASTPAGLRVDPVAARAAGLRYLAAAGATGTITVIGPTTVRATAHVSHRTAILSVIGIDRVSVTLSATASDLVGVRTPVRP